MNHDKLLSSKNNLTLVLLVMGAAHSGKTKLIESIGISCKLKKESYSKKTYYEVSTYSIEDSILKEHYTNLRIEFRELSSIELDTEFKMCSAFFDNAHIGLIVTGFHNEETSVE